jgi:hypothetical protein
VEETSWLLPIVVVPKNNDKLQIYANLQQLNAITKKDPYPLAFTEELLDEVWGMRSLCFWMDFPIITKS